MYLVPHVLFFCKVLEHNPSDFYVLQCSHHFPIKLVLTLCLDHSSGLTSNPESLGAFKQNWDQSKGFYFWLAVINA